MSTVNDDPGTTPSENGNRLLVCARDALSSVLTFAIWKTDSRTAVSVPNRRMSLAADLMMHIERRAAEGSAMFRSNVHNVVEELRPIITVARHPDPGSPQPLGPGSSVRLSLPTWLNLNANNNSTQLPISPPAPNSTETEDRNPIATGIHPCLFRYYPGWQWSRWPE